jgi:nucleoside diphosphate-linked moiety X motif protein 19
LYHERKLWLPPPQFAEIRRLNTIKSIDKLVEIAKNRNGQNMELLMPMQFKVQDGFLHVLPGDDLYPENPNYNDADHDVDEYSEKTMEEMRKIAKNICRSEQRDMFDVELVTNIKPSDGHISFLKSDPTAKM